MGDHDHHCLGKDGVWATQFGPSVYPVIETHLKTMFESRSKHDYNKAFKATRECPVMVTMPDLQDKLDKIKKRADRCAGYIHRAIGGNGMMLGSWLSEANHGSLNAHMGPGNVFSLEEQCMELFVHQKFLAQGRRKEMDDLYVKIKAYRSPLLTKELREDDELAKRALSPYHHARFQRSLKKSQKMTKICLGLGGYVTLPKLSKVNGDFQRDLKDALKRNAGSRHVAYRERCGCPDLSLSSVPWNQSLWCRNCVQPRWTESAS